MTTLSSGTAPSGTRAGLAVLILAAAGFTVPAAVAQRHVIGDAVAVQPPAPRVEAIGAAPHPGYVFDRGYWKWADGRHVWVPGHWQPPRRGYHWVPTIWVHEGNGWRMREGYWARR
jgi:hypothetical protein